MQGMPSDTLTDKLYNVPFRMTHCGNFKAVTLNSEIDFYLRNGLNGDFFTKWSYKIQFY